jgi:hypothetical protein
MNIFSLFLFILLYIITVDQPDLEVFIILELAGCGELLIIINL